MRKILHIIFLLAAMCSCSRFDDGDIWDELREHEERIMKLEQICMRLNEEISAQQSILVALQGYDYVTGVADIMEDGKVVGYAISFSKGEPVNIYHGLDGMDCNAPTIGVSRTPDGEYYWTVDGERVDYEADVVVPKLKVVDGIWYVSYDNCMTWRELYPADINDDEEESVSFFESVDTSDPDHILITLVTGEQIMLPTWKAFRELLGQVNKLNTNISSLQNVVVALQNHDYVVDVQPVIADGIVVGHTIFFSDSLPVTIYHGKDGEDGNVPVIGVKKGDDGVYYWTVDGEWILDVPDCQFPFDDSEWIIDGEWLADENGNKVPAVGSDGRGGAMPQLKIEGGYWYVSFDGGVTWCEESLGPASGSADESIFSEISYDEDFLYLVLKNGETITVSRHPYAEGISYTVELYRMTHHSATFIGNVELSETDRAFSRVNIYYSDSSDFNIHTARHASTQAFDYNGNFSLTLEELDSNCHYHYCVSVEVLDEEVFGPVMNFKTEERVAEIMDLSIYTDVGGYLSSSYGSTQWVNSHSTYFHYQIPLADLGYPSWITITANAAQTSYVAFFKAKATADHQSALPPYASGLDMRFVMDAGTVQTFDLPEDAEYLYLLSRSSSGSHAPELIEYGSYPDRQIRQSDAGTSL